MIKKFALIFSILLITQSVQAFEDCIVTNNGKLTDISIEDNTVVDVYPLITVMNEKNTLIVHPIKKGKTRFCVLKNNKNISMFTVEVSEFNTTVNAPEGFEVLTSTKIPLSNSLHTFMKGLTPSDPR